MVNKKNIERIWKILLGVTFALFFVVGITQIVINLKLLEGAVYLITSLLFLIAEVSIFQKKIVLESDKTGSYIYLGFIFLIVGASSMLTITIYGIFLWIAGLILFLTGVYKNWLSIN